MADGRDYTGLYFDELEEAGQRVLRDELEEFTETSPKDPLNAFNRLDSFHGHRLSALTDFVASELGQPTFTLRSSGIGLARGAGQTVAADSPASVDILADISGVPGPADVLVPSGALFSTPGDADNPSVTFESQSGDVVVGTLGLTFIEDDGGVFGTPTTSAIASLWGGTPAVGDAVYVGHAAAMHNYLTLTEGTPGSGFKLSLEYHDGSFRTAAPATGTVVDNLDGTLSIDCDTLVDTGTATVTGLVVRVTHVRSGSYEDRPVAMAGSPLRPRITTTSYLGQTSPSTNSGDYELSAAWLPVTEAANGSTVLDPAASQDVEWQLPQEATDASGNAIRAKWQTTSVNGNSGYWVRLRVTEVTTPSSPVSWLAAPNVQNTWTIALLDALQGRTVADVLGTTTGAPFDAHALNESPYIEGSLSSVVYGTDDGWTETESLLDADSNDKVFWVEIQTSGDYHIVTGDGTTGAIPAAGLTVTATYRVGAEEDGNVGANTVTNPASGVSFVTNIRNPHEASGWTQREGADEAGIERLRYAIPARQRARTRAVTPEDHEVLGVSEFRTADGRRPFERIIAVEQGAGYKTLALVCVGGGGSVPTASDLAELEAWFNGVRVGYQRIGGRTMH
ncbi:MAG: hypothetical protein ACPGQD_01930, partial [Planctomycetota bacterium]